MLHPSAVVELIMRDASGDNSAITVFAPSSLAHATIAANAEAFAAIAVPLSGCSLVGIRIKYRSGQAVRVEASGDTPITRTGALFFRDDSGDVAGVVLVHALVDSALVASGPGAGVLIDLTNEAVSDLISAVLDAGLTNPFAVPFVDVHSAYLQSRI